MRIVTRKSVLTHDIRTGWSIRHVVPGNYFTVIKGVVLQRPLEHEPMSEGECEQRIKRYNQAKEDGTLNKHYPKVREAWRCKQSNTGMCHKDGPCKCKDPKCSHGVTGFCLHCADERPEKIPDTCTACNGKGWQSKTCADGSRGYTQTCSQCRGSGSKPTVPGLPTKVDFSKKTKEFDLSSKPTHEDRKPPRVSQTTRLDEIRDRYKEAHWQLATPVTAQEDIKYLLTKLDTAVEALEDIQVEPENPEAAHIARQALKSINED